jgi:hypothetical protein
MTVEKFVELAINKQLILAGHKIRFKDCYKIENWYSKYTMTLKQHKVWKKWFISEYRKRFDRSLISAKKEFLWFDLTYGLRIEY